jgi:hypothetical protein
MYAQNKVKMKLSQKVMLKGDDVQDVDYEEVKSNQRTDFLNRVNVLISM